LKKLYLFLFISLFVLSCISIFIGVSSVSMGDLLSGDQRTLQTLLVSRIPRLLSVLVTGIGMSISGVIMQQLTRNRFVSPATAATMNFASLGILVAMLFFTNASISQRIGVSFIFALGGSFLFLGILKQIKLQNTLLIPLLGLMLGNVVNSVTTFIAYQYNLVQNISSWSQGSFTNVLRGNYEFLFIGVPFVVLAFVFSKKITILGIGEDFAKNLGLNYRLIMMIGLVIVSVISSSVVVTVGVIPFVGLIIPNLVSMWLGDNLHENLGIIALIGALFLLVSDMIGRLIIFPFEMPISLIIGILGAVIFLCLLRRKSYAN